MESEFLGGKTKPALSLTVLSNRYTQTGELLDRIVKMIRAKIMSSAQMPRGTLLTPEEVAGITGLSTETLAQWRSQRRGIPYLKIGRNVVRYRQSDLDAFLNERIVPVERNL